MIGRMHNDKYKIYYDENLRREQREECNGKLINSWKKRER